MARLFCHRRHAFPEFFWTVGSFLCFYSFFHLPNSSCSYQIYRHCHFGLTFCLLYVAIHDLWNKVLFSRKTSVSFNLFCRDIQLLFKAFGKPSKHWKPIFGYRMKRIFFGIKTWKTNTVYSTQISNNRFCFFSIEISRK